MSYSEKAMEVYRLFMVLPDDDKPSFIRGLILQEIEQTPSHRDALNRAEFFRTFIMEALTRRGITPEIMRNIWRGKRKGK